MSITGERIKLLRLQKKLTSRQLAEMIGCSVRTIQRYENDDSFPDTENLTRLADVFGVSTDYLLGKPILDDRLELSFNSSQIYRLHRDYMELTSRQPQEGEAYYWLSYQREGPKGMQIVCHIPKSSETPKKIIPLKGELLQQMMDICCMCHGRPMVLNHVQEIPLFYLFGGHAFAKICLYDYLLKSFGDFESCYVEIQDVN